MKKRKKWWLTITIIIVVLICITNIVFASFYPSNGANIFTAVSGWISGIATAVLGVLAFYQNKKYTLLSYKKELKNEIEKEKKMLLDLFYENVQQTRFTNVFCSLVLSEENTDQKCLTFKLSIDKLRESLLQMSTTVRLLKYIPENMTKLVSKILEGLQYTYRGYKTAEDYIGQDKLLADTINEVNAYARAWLVEMIYIRNKIFEEFNEKTNKVNSFCSLDAGNDYLESIELKNKQEKEIIDKNIAELIEKSRQEDKDEKNGNAK